MNTTKHTFVSSLVMAACVASFLGFAGAAIAAEPPSPGGSWPTGPPSDSGPVTGSPSAPGASGKPGGTPKTPAKPTGRNPIGDACRQHRSRDCPTWIDYVVTVTYRGTENVEYVHPKYGLLAEEERTVTWSATSPEPSRVNRSFSQIELEKRDFVVRFATKGKYDSLERRTYHRFNPLSDCPPIRETHASAFVGQVAVDGYLQLDRQPNDTVLYGLAGGRHGVWVTRKSGMEFARAYSCETKRPPWDGKETVQRDVRDGYYTLPLPSSAKLRGNISSAKQYGDRVISSGPVNANVAWSRPSTYGGQSRESGEQHVTWTWKLRCARTSLGKC
jgi:hypothetical protein